MTAAMGAKTDVIEGFKRPNHADFKTTQELKEEKFSGIRHNSLARWVEIWTLGNIEKVVTDAKIEQDPNAVNRGIEEVFALHAGSVKERK